MHAADRDGAAKGMLTHVMEPNGSQIEQWRRSGATRCGQDGAVSGLQFCFLLACVCLLGMELLIASVIVSVSKLPRAD